VNQVAIRVEGLGKQFRIGVRPRSAVTLRESLTEAMHRLPRALRPGTAERHRTFWALRDVWFSVERGEVVGVIGRNGAGKTTLLKILSRITAPTSGRAVIAGRVGSLLEVGSGFHPELSGRDNVYLNGAILGMRRAEIARRFDEIVAFAEVEEFVDTAVKHYSTGMYLRLAFAVAAHLEPDILIVDEVLAVGDVAFQKKCLGKMGDVARAGRTVLFVSHNMAALRALCQRAVVLDHGRLVEDTTDLPHAINVYTGTLDPADMEWRRPEHYPPGEETPIVFTALRRELTGEQPNHVLEISGELRSLRTHAPAFLAFDITDATLAPLMQALPTQEPVVHYDTGPQQFHVAITLPPLIPGTYRIHAWIGPHYMTTFDYLESPLSFTISASPTPKRSFPHSPEHGFVVPHSTIAVARPASERA
jgi:lipopolysaccharide transport system ATP-binding protein